MSYFKQGLEGLIEDIYKVCEKDTLSVVLNSLRELKGEETFKSLAFYLLEISKYLVNQIAEIKNLRKNKEEHHDILLFSTKIYRKKKYSTIYSLNEGLIEHSLAHLTSHDSFFDAMFANKRLFQCAKRIFNESTIPVHFNLRYPEIEIQTRCSNLSVLKNEIKKALFCLDHYDTNSAFKVAQMVNVLLEFKSIINVLLVWDIKEHMNPNTSDFLVNAFKGFESNGRFLKTLQIATVGYSVEYGCRAFAKKLLRNCEYIESVERMKLDFNSRLEIYVKENDE